jgi:hypothetical protein
VSATPGVVSSNEISLGGNYYPIDGPVLETLISILPGKLQIGDATRSDSQLSSAWTQSSAKGGQLKERAIPSQDIDRSYISTSETRYDNQIGLPPYVEDIARPDGITDDATLMFEYANVFYTVFGTRIFKRDETVTPNVWADIGVAGAPVNLPGAPSDSVYYAGYQWIACGDGQDIQRFAGGTSVAAATATHKATYLCVRDATLFTMKMTGALESAVDTGTIAWATEGALDLPGQYTVGLRLFRDVQGNPMLYAATKQGLYAYESAAKLWHATALAVPRQQYGGVGSDSWRGEYFYDAGLDMLKYNLATVSNVGLNRDDGLPGDENGNIIRVVGSLSWLYVFVRNTERAGADPVPIYGGDMLGDSAILPASEAFSTLWATDGNGIWHRLWTSATVAGNISSAGIFVSHDSERLWWYADARVYRMDIPAGIHNPLKNPNARFQQSSWHVTPWFDADWQEELKIAINLRVGVKGISQTERIHVLVGFDDVEGFPVDLGYIDASTLTSPTGVVQFWFGEQLGKSFYRIRFRFEFERDATDTSVSPFLRFYSLAYLKAVDAIFGYDMTVDLMQPHKGRSPAQMDAELRSITGEPDRDPILVPFRYLDARNVAHARIVRVTRYRSADQTGLDGRRKVILSLGEVFPQ